MVLYSLMVANFSDIHSESVIFRHEFPFLFQKFNQLIHIHIFSRTSIKKLIFSKLLYDSILSKRLPYNCFLPSYEGLHEHVTVP